MLPYSRQSINEDDITSVIEVLKSNYLTQGPQTQLFEQAIKNYCTVNYALSVCNATAALHLACLSLGVGQGDTVWTSPNTFVASANCVLYCNAKIDFVDIDPQTYNISIDALKAKLALADKQNKLPKVVIVVHFSGQSCEMSEVKKLAEQYHFAIIEDASHALGAQYQGKYIGHCIYSDICIFSFHPVKMITSAEGGMLTTNNSKLAKKIELLRSAGITKDPKILNNTMEGNWYYEQQLLGYNYRMNDIQAALGVSQLQRLNLFVGKRTQLAEYYQEKLLDLPLILPAQHDDCISSWHLFVVKVDSQKTDISRRKLYEQLHQQGIGAQIHYIPVHTQPFYEDLGFRKGDFPESENYYKEVLSLPLYYDLTHEDQDYIINTLNKIFTYDTSDY